MRACGGDLQAGALGGSHKFATGALHVDAQFADVFANFRAGLDDGLMHLVLDLFDDVRRSGGDELHYVRTKLTGSGINNLKFFFYADGEAVSHGVALRDLKWWGLLSAYHTALVWKIHPCEASRTKLWGCSHRLKKDREILSKKEGQTRASA